MGVDTHGDHISKPSSKEESSTVATGALGERIKVKTVYTVTAVRTTENADH